MPSTTIRIALFLLASSAALVAQGNQPAAGGRNTEAQQQALRKQREIEAADDGSASKSGDVKESVDNLEDLTPEQRLERGTRSGASNYCRFVASIRPARLLPGQTGIMYVVASLQGQAVLPAPAPLQVTSPAQQGIVSLGAPSFHPAEPGRLAKGYLGVPVYDNTAILEIPVTVAPDAPIGKKQAVHVDLKFDLFDGATAQVVGRFVDRAVAEIEVGRTADPNVTMPVVEQGTASVRAPGGRAPVDGDGDNVRMRPSALDGDAAAPAPAPAASVGSQSRELPAEGPPAPAGGGSVRLLIIAGGALLLLLVVMIVSRK